VRDYEGKKAVVVGGTHGMGLAVVKQLLAGGAEVLLTGSNEKNVIAAREELGDGIWAVQSDVTDRNAIAQLRSSVESNLGQIDYLHVNVGVAAVAPFEEVTEEAYDWMFNTNTKGAFFTVQALAPLISQGGAVTFTTAVTNGMGSPTMSVYSGTKAAVLAFAKVLAAEFLPRGIRVNTVAPGFIDTPTMGFVHASAEERAQLMAVGDEVTPMKRHGTVDEVARAALFLAFAATFTTGIELPVDGGLGHVEIPQ
jgi:NAD(P)-dependent dehydrogenase (short-subunit alcohol dehydrogenase family)